MKHRQFFRPLLWLFALVLAGCGGGGGGSGGGSTNDAPDPGGSNPPEENTPVTISTGAITGFGSIFINGVKYSTNGSDITTDERMSAAESDLEVGMFVTVRGEMHDDEQTGEAHGVHYGEYIRGPIDAIDLDTNSLTVMGMQVFVDDLTLMDDVDFESLAPGDVVEVSGPNNGNRNVNRELFASRMTLVTDTQLSKTHGVIEELDASLMTFSIGGITVDYHLAEDLPGDTLANNMFVVVMGEFDNDGNLIAETVHSRGEPIEIEAGDHMMMRGVVDDFQSTSEFTLNGQNCLINADTVFEGDASEGDIALNRRLRIEGTINEDDVLVVERVGLHRDAELSMRGAVEHIDRDAGTITVNGMTFESGQETRFFDHGMHMRRFGFDNIEVGDPVEIRGAREGEDYLAMMILRHEGTDSETFVDLMGEISAINVTESTFTVLDKTVRVNEDTSFRIRHGATLTLSQFFESLENGDVIRIIGNSEGEVVAAEEVMLRTRHHGMMGSS